MSIRIRVTKNGKAPVWELLINDMIAYRFEGYTEVLEHAVQTASSLRYVEHDEPERMKR